MMPSRYAFSRSTLNTIINKLQSLGKMRFYPAATEQGIKAFENKNNFKLPTGFKEWLRFSDGGECFLPAGIQLYGVSHEPRIHTEDNDKPDDSYLVIGALASGDPILCEKESERISIFNLETGRIEADEVYSDFFAFLNDLYVLLGIVED